MFSMYIVVINPFKNAMANSPDININMLESIHSSMIVTAITVPIIVSFIFVVLAKIVVWLYPEISLEVLKDG